MNLQQGILNVVIPTPDDSSVMCTMTITWTLIDGQLQGMPVNISITGPIQPHELDNLPLTSDKIRMVVDQALGELAQNMRSEAMKLKPASLEDLRSLPPMQGKS